MSDKVVWVSSFLTIVVGILSFSALVVGLSSILVIEVIIRLLFGELIEEVDDSPFSGGEGVGFTSVGLQSEVIEILFVTSDSQHAIKE